MELIFLLSLSLCFISALYEPIRRLVELQKNSEHERKRRTEHGMNDVSGEGAMALVFAYTCILLPIYAITYWVAPWFLHKEVSVADYYEALSIYKLMALVLIGGVGGYLSFRFYQLVLRYKIIINPMSRLFFVLSLLGLVLIISLIVLSLRFEKGV